MPLPEAFRTFMEYLLTRLDHSDERAVKAAYDIYGQSSAGGVELKELKSLLLMPYEKDEAKTEPEGLDDTEPEGSKAYATVGQKEQDGKRDASIWKQIFAERARCRNCLRQCGRKYGKRQAQLQADRRAELQADWQAELQADRRVKRRAD